MSPVKKTVNLSLEKITERVYVRRQLDDDRVLYLAEQYEAGTKIENIAVTEKTHVLVYGRHRLAAMRFLGLKETRVDILPEMSDEDILTQAFRENYGGPMPPSTADIGFTIEQLLNLGVSGDEIRKRIPLPPAMARKYLSNVRTRLTANRTLAAVRAVQEENLTVLAASLKFNVKEQAIKEIIAGRRRKKEGLPEIKAALEHIFRTRGQLVRGQMIKLRDYYEDGHIKMMHVQEMLTYVHKANQSMARSLEDWVNRFDSMNENKKKAS